MLTFTSADVSKSIATFYTKFAAFSQQYGDLESKRRTLDVELDTMKTTLALVKDAKEQLDKKIVGVRNKLKSTDESKVKTFLDAIQIFQQQG
jgi:hypothetical protein